jgi:hypothetical protein
MLTSHATTANQTRNRPRVQVSATSRSRSEQPREPAHGPNAVRRVAVIAILLVAGSVGADEDTELHEGLTREATGPLLDLETTLRSYTEGLDAESKREQYDFTIGRHTRAQLEANAWQSPLLAGKGYGATLRLVHDFKVIQVGVEASVQRVDSQFAHGSYYTVGLSLTRTLRLSKWMIGWLSLSIGRRKWLGNQAPPGEADDTTLMLSLGTTFR